MANILGQNDFRYGENDSKPSSGQKSDQTDPRLSNKSSE